MFRSLANRARQSGQVLWLALALLLLASLGLVFMVASGQLVAEKRRLVNAADSAAYSAAAWRARVMNFQAYSNRAIIAQEVAVAQVLTLVSWARYFEHLSEEAGKLSGATGEIGDIGRADIALAAKAARETTEQAAALDLWLRAAPQTGYKSLLSANQELLQHSAGVFGLGAVANEVVRASDSRQFAFALPDQGYFESLSRRYTNTADRQRLADLVLRSLDAFVRGPRGVDLSVTLPDPCSNAAAAPHTYRKRGSTRLADDLQSWQAFDLGSVHSLVDPHQSPSSNVLCTGTERRALGWGELQSGHPADFSRQGDSDPLLRVNPSARQRALAEMSERHNALLEGYDGIAAVREISERFRSSALPVSAPVAVLARKDERHLNSSRLASLFQGRLHLNAELPNQRLWALAAASTYFRRPPSFDASGVAIEQIELASLFNPYWQARLQAPSADQRELASSYAN